MDTRNKRIALALSVGFLFVILFAIHMNRDKDVEVSESELVSPFQWKDCYFDRDGDGYGSQEVGLQTSKCPPDFPENSDDCDDTRADISPKAREICDGLDNDCDGRADVEAFNAFSWYADADNDGFGDPNEVIAACNVPNGYVQEAMATDCDDTRAKVYPGAKGQEDNVPNDCDLR